MNFGGYSLAVISAVLWGLVYALDGKILNRISPLTLLFVHGVLSSLILLPFVFHEFAGVKELFTPEKRNTLSLVIFSMVLGTIANFTVLSAIQKLSASTASIIEITYPLFVVLFSALLFGYKVNIFVALGAVLIFLGSFVVIRYG